MGKPRLIILIRHAQSEGNKNREIHQLIPDHRVKLTEDGWRQAEDAGRRLRRLLKPDDTLQIYTSPYRRTRETTEGILSTLTARADPNDPHATPSPFSREKIQVYEEPRLREQDFGNFQPCSAEMERMWRERADYGHFFYRIPNGESAADAYDRIAGFNESLWRQFGEKDFPSVCVLVTHGLMTRVFLMKWFHWSVEYFEDLRNVGHCEMILMRLDEERGKYRLEAEMRTWSELKRERERVKEQEEERRNPQRRNTLSSFLKKPVAESPVVPPRQWGGCVGGCNHHHERYPRRKMEEVALPPAAASSASQAQPESDTAIPEPAPLDSIQSNAVEDAAPPPSNFLRPPHLLHPSSSSLDGTSTPHEMSDDDEYFSPKQEQPKSIAAVMRRPPQRKATPEDIQRWAQESGMGRGLGRADELGDGAPAEDDEVERKDNDEATVIEDVEEEMERERGVRESVY